MLTRSSNIANQLNIDFGYKYSKFECSIFGPPPLYYNPAFYPLMSIFAVERINWPPNPYSPSAHNGSVSSGLDNGASDDSEEDNNGHRQLVTIQLNLSLLVIWFKFRSLQVICCYITHCMKNLGIRVHIFAGTNGFIVIL